MKQLLFIMMLFTTCKAEAVDSFTVHWRVPAKERIICSINTTTGTIEGVPSNSTLALTEKTLQAIARAPQWLTITLEDRFSRMNTSLQNTYAQMILDAHDPFVDEIAFTVAHLPPEVINSKNFYTALITENAQGVYRADSTLAYVEIIDSGSAVSGGDYFSTTRYTVKKGSTNEIYTLPRYYYYWFIVFPKLQGEFPAYINPADPNPTSPENGAFWRTYFLTHRESGCGSLLDTISGMTFLWANIINNPSENGALGRLSQWCTKVLPWGGNADYRWPQPVYLYNQHAGTCSEHGWFASAAARTALIPVTLTKAARFDHKWNEFYVGRWIDWEPVNGWIDRIDEPAHANDYWSDPKKTPMKGCFNWRGDGFIWCTTEHYSPVCTLDVSVTDSRGAPLDGARVTIDADGVPGNFLLAGWTGSDGACRFLLDDRVDAFTAAVNSALGVLATKTIITGSIAGKQYAWSAKVSGAAPQISVCDASSRCGDAGTCSVRLSIDAKSEIVYGRHEYSLYGYSFPCTFSDERSTGSADVFVCDSVNYAAYSSGKQFEAVLVLKNTAVADTTVTLPAASGTWYAVVSGEEKSVNTTVAALSVKLLKQGAAVLSQPLTTDRFLSRRIVVDKRHLRITPLEAADVTIFSVNGTVVVRHTVSSGADVIDVSTLPFGIYLCRVTPAHDVTFAFRFVKGL